ncbi:MAG TPA: ABC transporter substrate-binding protein [Leeuwenhoekiella sp.]|nr:ABC transporter substrate-binding protein [Leeuwenhoekiella sp.]
MKTCVNLSTILLFLLAHSVFAQNAKDYEHRYDAPWETSPLAGTVFTGYGIDNAPDFHGDVNNPDLVVFFAGNQYVAVPELLEAFRKKYPKYSRVFAETIPPGIEGQQLESGNLILGNMRISLKPDIVTAGKGKIEQGEKEGRFIKTLAYAKNKLAIMVAKDNPKNIKSLYDLGRADVKISMPNPEWEGIATRIIKAYENAGGNDLKTHIMNEKLSKNTTYLTTIHHRQTPLRIMYGESDAGPVWYSEAYYQSSLTNHPIDMVAIPDAINVEATYMAGQLKTAPHPEAASAFMEFLTSQEAVQIYKKYGFSSVN